SHYFVTWRVGLYIGLSIPLMIRAVDLAFSNRVSLDLFEHVIQSEMLHLYAACIIPILFLLLFGINMYIWSSFGINYKFIFDFNPRKNLDFKQFLELRVIGSGFYHVEFRDFFIADILNSLTYTATLLFCTLGDCHENWTCIVPLLSSLPAWWRFVQCWKRYFDTLHKFPHLANAGKYFLSMATIWIFYLDISTSLSIGSQIISSTYSLIWDLLMDWSLLQLDSKNYLLRDNINFKSYIYYFAIISNGLLRFSWILKFTIPHKYNKLTVYAIGYFEMLRRWQWSLLRIENEHVNNCGQFRAVKEIPLPFEKEETIREKTGLQKLQEILIPENNLFPTILFHDNSKFEDINEEETNTNLAESTKDDMLTINRQRELSLISLEGGLKKYQQ
ncbi:13412_t:CDS:2, partial [Funneliformis caledonium]